MDNRSLSHTRWKCQYHIVFIPKYRKRILYGRLREDIKEIISTLCKYRKVEIIAGVNIPLRRSRLSGKMETTCPDRRKPL